MPEWLNPVVSQAEVNGLTTLVPRLLVAFVLGFVVAGVYHFGITRPGQKSNRTFLATLVLLSVVIALVTLVIGDNVARAFSLVGALAIVRFRTVVEDTRDTAFVMFSVVAGMSAGSGYLLAPILCTPLVFLASWLFRTDAAAVPSVTRGSLILRLGVHQPTEADVQTVLQQYLPQFHLITLGTARGGSALDATYAIVLPGPEKIFALVSALNRLEGVQSVEVRDNN